jgi:hypothetical protein
MDNDKPVDKQLGGELPSKPSNSGKMPSSAAGIIEEIEDKLENDADPAKDRDDAVADIIRKGDRE